MGEKCSCPSYGGTALYHHGEITVECPIHGEQTRKWGYGADVSVWQNVVSDGDILKITATIGEVMAENVDINIMSEAFKGTISYGKELEKQGQEVQEIEVRDASPGPRDIHSSEGDE